jgi:hypothetical protein
MSVIKLRIELGKLNLDVDGLKQVLVSRVEEAEGQRTIETCEAIDVDFCLVGDIVAVTLNMKT